MSNIIFFYNINYVRYLLLFINISYYEIKYATNIFYFEISFKKYKIINSSNNNK